MRFTYLEHAKTRGFDGICITEAAKRLISDINKEPHSSRVLTVSGELIPGGSVGVIEV
jgi:deoxyhypusine synthase